MANEISHIVESNDNLITTSETNFALATASLSTSTKWKTVSVNGREVTLITGTCRTSTKKRSSLSESESELIDHTKTKLESSAESSGSSSYKDNNCLSRYQLTEGGSVTTNCNIKESLISSNGFSVSKQDDKHYSVSKYGLPNKLARLFVLDDVIGFVYLDGEVIMKPVDCLSSKEQRLLKSLEGEVHQVAENVMKNIEDKLHVEIVSDLNKNNKLTEQNLNSEIQDLTKNINSQLGDIFSGF